MNAKTFKGLVASLIATTMLFLVSASAAPVKGQKGVETFDASAKKVTTIQQSTVTVYRTVQGGYTLSPTSEIAFTAWAPGTPGTFSGRVNEDGSITMPAGKRLVMNANFAVAHPIHNALTGFVAPTGTRKLLEVIAPTGDEFGSHRLVGVTTSYAKAEELVASTPNAFVSQWGWAVPTEAKGVWVNNEYPSDQAIQTGRGDFISRFDLTLSSYPRTDLVTDAVNRFSDFDQSRDTFYAPGYNSRSTIQAKSITVATVATQMLSSRIVTLVHEPTGKVYHMDSYARNSRIWIWDPRNPNDPNPKVLTQLNTNDPNVEAQLSGRMYGDMLFRFIAVNSFQAARLEVWNVVTELKVAEYPINARVADGGGVQSPRGEYAFDPRRNTVWIASAHAGKVYALNLNNGTLQDVPVPAVGASTIPLPRDVAVDSARDVAYVVVMATRADGHATYDPGRVVEVSLETKTLTGRSVQVGIAPWSIAIAPVRGVNHLFVTNSADGGNNQLGDDSLSIVDTATFTEALPRLITRNQPTNLVVELMD